MATRTARGLLEVSRRIVCSFRCSSRFAPGVFLFSSAEDPWAFASLGPRARHGRSRALAARASPLGPSLLPTPSLNLVSSFRVSVVCLSHLSLLSPLGFPSFSPLSSSPFLFCLFLLFSVSLFLSFLFLSLASFSLSRGPWRGSRVRESSRFGSTAIAPRLAARRPFRRRSRASPGVSSAIARSRGSRDPRLRRARTRTVCRSLSGTFCFARRPLSYLAGRSMRALRGPLIASCPGRRDLDDARRDREAAWTKSSLVPSAAWPSACALALLVASVPNPLTSRITTGGAPLFG